MELNTLYKSILRFAGMEVDEEGLVYLNAGSERRPALMNGLRLVLPTDNVLKAPPSKDRVIFHPLSENTLLGESEIISHLLKVMNIRLNMTFGILGSNLLQLVASPELHKHLTPDQAELLIQIKDVDDLAVVNFSNIMLAAIKVDNEDIYTNIYLRRGGIVNGKKFARAGFTKFKLYEEILKDPSELYGVKLRVKDRAIIKALHEFIFPNIATKQAYDVGSSSHVAPFLDALMRTSLGLAAMMNDLLVQYKDFIENCEDLVFDADWVAAFDDLDSMRNEIRRVPPQAGNEGKTAPVQAAMNVPNAVTTQADRDRAALAIPGAITKVEPPKPEVAAPVQAPVAWPQNQQQQMFQTTAAAAPQVQATSRGLDYSSMMAANPTLRPPMPGQMGMVQMQNQMPPPMTVPAWAGGGSPTITPIPGQMLYDAMGRPVMLSGGMQTQQPMVNNWPGGMMGGGQYPQQQQQFQQTGFVGGGVVRV